MHTRRRRPGQTRRRLKLRQHHNHHHHNNHHIAHCSREDFCAEPKRVTMPFVARDAGSSAARRRRERRLRSWLRQERMTVRTELAAALPTLRSEVQGPRRTTLYEAGRLSTPRGMPSCCHCLRKSSEVRGLTVSPTSGRRSKFSGAPWSI